MSSERDAEIRKIPVTQGIISNCHYVIMGLLIFTIIVGVFTGYYYNAKDNVTMFIPLLIAFITTFICYMFIDLRSELVAHNKEKAMYLCRIYCLLLLACAAVVGVFTGYYYNAKDNVTMFLPLLIAFICVVNAYLFIEIRGQLEADKLVDPY